MCMKRTSRIKVAKEDIPVWKVMMKHHYSGELVTCFVGTSILKITSEKVSLTRALGQEFCGYHCYPDRATALLLKKAISHRKTIVKRMYIPKGAKYAEGVDFRCSEETDGKPVYQASILKLKSNV